MILTIDTTGKRFTVTKTPEPRMIGDEHRTDKATGLPLWITQLVAVDADGGDIINVTTAGEKPPPVDVDDPVVVHRLVAFPWHSNGRVGVAYRAAGFTIEADLGAD